MQTETSLKQNHSEYARIIQITDTHIQADPDDVFDEVNTRRSLNKVIQHLLDHAGNFDAMLVTGDLVHDTAAGAYAALAAILGQIPAPVFCIPGNHDDPELMERHLNAGNISTEKNLLFDHWHVCLLDSWLPGTHAGKLQQAELQFLDRALSVNQDRHALVILHHPPVPVGSPWMDAMALKNPAALFSVLERHKQVRAVLWGHIHQEFTGRHGDIRLLATPSTCIQFSPGATEYEKDSLAPGYRVLKLLKNGTIETDIIRVATAAGETAK